MSVCAGPGCPTCDEHVANVAQDLYLRPPEPPRVDPAEIEWQIEELMELRRMAKSAARSGDPAIRAEAKRGIEECNEHLAAMRELLGKVAPSAVQ